MFFASPLEQFEIIPLLSVNLGDRILSLTNETLFFLLIFGLLCAILKLSFYEHRLIPVRWQSLVEEIFFFTKDLVVKNIGVNHIYFFPLVFFLFNFILLSNLVGMIPYSFTVTSHIIVTFALALSLFIGINLIGIKTHGIVLLEFFMPAGAPRISAPFFVAIEMISYLARVFSLSIRLFANLMSGHALLKILAGFSWDMLISAGIILKIASILPFSIIIAVTILELAIAFLQAYVFTILVCLYLHDVIALAH